MKDDEPLKAVIDSLERTLLHIQEKLKSAHVLNGGFDRLMEKVDSIEGTQEKILGELNTVKVTIYDPDTGIYSRIKAVDDRNDERAHAIDKSIAEIKVSQDKLVETTKNHAEEVQKVKDLEKKVDDLSKWKSNTGKIVWAVVVPVVTTFGKIIYDFLAAHVQLK
jgi:uncharacterized protein Yka (UPF0111/DUF47 family)